MISLKLDNILFLFWIIESSFKTKSNEKLSIPFFLGLIKEISFLSIFILFDIFFLHSSIKSSSIFLFNLSIFLGSNLKFISNFFFSVNPQNKYCRHASDNLSLLFSSSLLFFKIFKSIFLSFKISPIKDKTKSNSLLSSFSFKSNPGFFITSSILIYFFGSFSFFSELYFFIKSDI